MIVGQLLEVILYVDDMQQAVSFYTEQLGLTVAFPHRDDYRNEHWVVFETGPCKLCLHSGGDGTTKPNAPKVVFHVEDIQASRRELLARGVALGEVRSPSAGVAVCDGVDPAGNRFSIESHSHTR